MEFAPNEPAVDHRPPYQAPRLRYIGSIADVTQAEGSGPGGFNSSGSPQRSVTILNNTSLDSETIGRSVNPNQ